MKKSILQKTNPTIHQMNAWFAATLAEVTEELEQHKLHVATNEWLQNFISKEIAKLQSCKDASYQTSLQFYQYSAKKSYHTISIFQEKQYSALLTAKISANENVEIAIDEYELNNQRLTGTPTQILQELAKYQSFIKIITKAIATAKFQDYVIDSLASQQREYQLSKKTLAAQYELGRPKHLSNQKDSELFALPLPQFQRSMFSGNVTVESFSKYRTSRSGRTSYNVDVSVFFIQENDRFIEKYVRTETASPARPLAFEIDTYVTDNLNEMLTFIAVFESEYRFQWQRKFQNIQEARESLAA